VPPGPSGIKMKFCWFETPNQREQSMFFWRNTPISLDWWRILLFVLTTPHLHKSHSPKLEQLSLKSQGLIKESSSKNRIYISRNPKQSILLPSFVEQTRIYHSLCQILVGVKSFKKERKNCTKPLHL